VKPSVRETLAETHISAVAIALLLLWSLDSGVQALWGPLYRTAGFLFTALAIWDVPYFSHTLSVADRFMWMTTFSYVFGSLICLAAAWLLSRWVYGMGPLRSLSTHYSRLRRRTDV
jgi:hypothetical protein